MENTGTQFSLIRQRSENSGTKKEKVLLVEICCCLGTWKRIKRDHRLFLFFWSFFPIFFSFSQKLFFTFFEPDRQKKSCEFLVFPSFNWINFASHFFLSFYIVSYFKELALQWNKCMLRNYIIDSERKLWSSGRVLGSQLESRGFDPCPMLDGSGVKAMPG